MFTKAGRAAFRIGAGGCFSTRDLRISSVVCRRRVAAATRLDTPRARSSACHRSENWNNSVIFPSKHGCHRSATSAVVVVEPSRAVRRTCHDRRAAAFLLYKSVARNAVRVAHFRSALLLADVDLTAPTSVPSVQHHLITSAELMNITTTILIA